MDPEVTRSAPLEGRAPPGPAWLLRRRAAREWLAWSVLWLAVLAYTAMAMWKARDALIARDLDRLQSQAEAVEMNLTRQLRSVSDALAGVRQLVMTDQLPHGEGVPPQLRLLADAMPGVGVLQLLDAQGLVVAASRAGPVGHNFSERHYFIGARELNGPDLFVSPPFQTIAGRTTTVLSGALRDADGRFAGAVTASLDPEYFELVMRASLYADDARATLVHGDGRVIVSSPLQDARPGFDLNVEGSMFRQHMESGHGASVQQGVRVGTGEARMMAMRTIAPSELHMNRPLVVRLSRRTDAVLEPWRNESRNEALLLLAAMAASAAWLRWHQRRRRLQERTELAAARAERDSARRLEFGLRGADLGLWEWNLADGSVTVNARELEMLGYPPTSEPLRQAFWRSLLHPDDADALDRAVKAHLRNETPSYRLEHRHRHRDGHWIWVQTHAMVMERDARGRPRRVVGTHLDISERKRAQMELERMNAQLAALSLTDDLTGVANRRQFDQALAAEWARALRQRHPLALLMIDVDHFKLYNDELGHPQGDICLRAVAQLLTGCLRQPVERLARYGGEEFAVLLLEADDDAGERVAQRCLHAVAVAALPHPASPLGPHVTLSIGVASLLPQPELLPEQLVHAADTALYRAKQQGRARHALATEADMLPRSTGLQALAR